MAVICCSISGSGPGAGRQAGRQAGRDKFIASYGDRFKVRITAPPVDGKANAHLNCFLAKAFGVGRNDVTLVKDSSTKSKGFRIHKPQKFPKSLAFAVTGERTG